MNQLPYQCSMNALVAIALFDKKERERLIAQETERQQFVTENREISLYAILEDVCMVFKTPIEKVKSKSRTPGLVVCKRIYCYLACTKTKRSLSEIGREICFDDHTTVMHHRDNVKKMLHEEDPDFMVNWRYYLHNSKVFVETDF